MANIESLILRDTRANQPAAGIPGRLYYVTDESVLERDNGSTWDDVSTSNVSDAELAAIAGLTSAANKIIRFTGSGTADLLDFKDEDDMASDSATAVPSQQSVKAYVDANAGGASTNITGAYDIEGDGSPTYTDAGMSDEFLNGTGQSGNTNGLAAKWTAVGGAAGTIDLYTDNIADSVYDLATRPGCMMVQTDIGDKIMFRQDDMLVDDESIVVSLWIPSPHDAAGTNNTFRTGIAVNTDDSDYEAGTSRGLIWDGGDSPRVIQYSGATVYSEHILAPGGGRCYFRISRVSNVLHFFFSKDGVGWIDCGSVAIGTFSNFWVFADQTIASADGSAITIVNWVRHVASVAYDLW